MVRNRARLSWKQKKLILDECDRRNVTRGEKKILEICTWARSKLKLQVAPSYRSVLSIIRDAERVTEKTISVQRNMRKELVVTSMTIENELYKWVWDMISKEVFISDDLIKVKASGIQENLNQKYLQKKYSISHLATAGSFFSKKKQF